jgi:putative endonuclease
MKQFNYKKGKQGEEIARDFLIKKGYQIIKSNFQTRFGELDIVASKDNFLVFVEVKLKTGIDFGLPEEMINPKKLQQVQRTAEAFLLQNNNLKTEFKQYRIDAICITLDNNEINKINHYENLTG